MKVLLTLDDWQYDDRDYEVVETNLSEKKLEKIIKKFIAKNEYTNCFDILEYLKNKGYIKEANCERFWIEIQH